MMKSTHPELWYKWKTACEKANIEFEVECAEARTADELKAAVLKYRLASRRADLLLIERFEE